MQTSVKPSNRHSRPLLLLVLLSAVAPAGAATRTVTNLNDDGAGSLRATLVAATNGDIINFSVTGTITLTSGQLTVNKNLSINGPGAGALSISGNNSSPVMSVVSNATISGLTFTAGRNAGAPFANVHGGGVSTSATVVMTDCTISGNTATGTNVTSGGGIYNVGNLTLNNCTVSNNSATGPGAVGGGIYNDLNCTLVVNNSTINGNSTTASGTNSGRFANGGGVSSQGSATLTGCTLSGNSATNEGGAVVGIANLNACTVANNHAGDYGGGLSGNGSISNCALSGNTAFRGGALSTSGTINVVNSTLSNNSADVGGAGYSLGTLTLTNSTFSGNSAENGGGAIAGYGPLVVRGSTFSTNRSNYGGGGALYSLDKLTMSDSTFSGNEDVFASGGAIYNTGVGSSVTNCTLSGNSAAFAGGIRSTGGGTLSLLNTILQTGTSGANLDGASGSTISNGHNLSNDDGSGLLTGPGDVINTNPLLGSLASNGGPTQTHALTATSPARDTGDDSVLNAPLNLTLDQRGYARRVGTHVDIGAFEFDPAQTGANLVVTTIGEHNDGICGAGDCTLYEALQVANASGDANTISFKPGLSGTIRNTGSPLGLSISSPLTISGPGARTITVSGVAVARVFYVLPGATALISGLTIANGNSVVSGGGSGGGIYNAGSLTLVNCAISNNDGGSGGGIASIGTLTVTGCTFNANRSTGNGGAIRNNGSATLTNSTFNNNTAVSSGAITTSDNSGAAASMTVKSCTISGNTGTTNAYGGGINNYGNSTVTISNTIVAGNSATNSPDVSGVFVSQGYNLIGDGIGGTGFNATGDQVGSIGQVSDNRINPLLGPLQDNGGPTNTMALLANSPAIDKGSAGGLTTDQRGFARPLEQAAIENADDGSDIGAFELTPTYSISGRIADAAGTAIAGVSVTRSGQSTPVFTSSAGYYTFTNVPNGSYTLTPTLNNYAFSPVSRSVTVNGASLASQNFTGKTGISLSGRISNNAGVAIGGVTVTRTGGSTPVQTNSAGYYTFIGVQPGSTTITPSKNGYRFIPTNKVVSAGSSDISGINFIGATGYNVAGRIANSNGVGQANISVKRSGSTLAVTTNSAGYYTFYDVPDGAVTITPTGTGLSFSPESRTITINGNDVSGQNFSVAPGYSLSGRITRSDGTAIVGVAVARSGSATIATTNSAGYFTFNSVANGTYTLTPSLNGYSFTPVTKSVTINGANISGQNFIGSGK